MANLVAIVKENPTLALRSSDITNAEEDSPSRASPSSDIADAFLVADQAGLTAAAHEVSGIAQPRAFEASSFDPDAPLSCDEAMAECGLRTALD